MAERDPDPPSGVRHVLDDLRGGRVPRWLHTSAAVSWRLLVVTAVAIVVLYGLIRLRVVVLPVVLAVVIAAALAPPGGWLRRRGLPRLLATWIVVLTAVAVVALAAWVLVPRLASSVGDVGSALATAYDDLGNWLVEGPMALDRATVDEVENRVVDRLQAFAQDNLTGRASLIVEILTGFFLTLVIAFFYIKDGDRFRDRFVAIFPERDQRKARDALGDGWSVLQRYLLGVVVVGTVDAVLIGVGLLVIGVPHVVPVMVLTFLAALFPLVGAIFAGLVAALIALAAGGIVDALLVVGLTIVVQQVDGDVVAPVVYGRALDLHPLSILLALTAGTVVGGIVGAFLAVPILAVSRTVVATWRSHETEPGMTAGSAG